MKSLLCSLILIRGKQFVEQNNNDILLGQSVSLSGSFGEIGQSYRDGAQLYFDKINREGGIHGRQVKLLTLDDGYKSHRAEENTLRLIHHDKVFALFGYSFTNTVKASLRIADAARIPFVLPFTGSDDLYTQLATPNLFTTRASFSKELDFLLRRLKSLGQSQVALVRYDSLAGGSLERKFHELVQEFGMVSAGNASMQLSSADASAAAARLSLNAERPAILLGISGTDALSFIEHYSVATQNHPTRYLVRSVAADEQLLTALDFSGNEAIISQLAPSPFEEGKRIAEEYRAEQRSAQHAGADIVPSHCGLEAYVAATVVTEALRRTGPSLTRQKFVSAFESIANWDCGGVVFDFSPSNHHGATFINPSVQNAASLALH